MIANMRTRVLRAFVFVVLLPLTVLLSGCGGPNLFQRLGMGTWGFWGTLVIVLDLIALFDLLGSESRSTTSRALWVLVIIFFPVGGVILYFLFGRE